LKLPSRTCRDTDGNFKFAALACVAYGRWHVIGRDDKQADKRQA
jgi:hypothetical protein